MTRQNNTLLIFIVLAFVATLLIIPFAFKMDSGLLPPQILLTFLVIGGVLALVIVLVIVVLILSRLQLTNKDEALGLPGGSIRALIALILLIAFVIFALHLFGASSGQNQVVEAANAEEYAQLLTVYGNSVTGASINDGKYKIVVHSEPSAAAQDMGNQILTMIGTLTAAVSAFYFGSRSVESALSDAAAVQPIISGFKGNPPNVKGGDLVKFTIKGRNFDNPTVTLEGTTTLPVEVTKWTKRLIDCQVTPPSTTSKVKYAVVVTNADGEDARGLEFVVS